jgi:hypothetical protein
LSDLYLRCTAFAQGEKKALVFSLDAISLNAQAFEIISEMITQATGVETDGIYITCVHSHTAFRVAKPSEAWSDTDVFLHWLAFVYAVPVSMLVWLIFNALWFNRRRNYLIISLMVWTLLIATHLNVLLCGYNVWQIYLLGIPGQLIIILWSSIGKRN